MLSTRNSLPSTDVKPDRLVTREGFFIEASKRIRRQFPDLLLIVTGGFRSRQGVSNALEDGACHAVGLGRPAVKFPDLPDKIMFNDELDKEEARFDVEVAPVPGWIATKIRSVGAGAETVSGRPRREHLAHPIVFTNFFSPTDKTLQKYYSSLLRQL
jgi:tRNA-dihydrouridine synthase